MSNVIDVLEERGFIDAITHEDLRELANKPLKVYCGFDPTSDSLHLGNMVALMGLAWFQRLGHAPVAIAGGATGRVGDPSGKSNERPLLDDATIEKNLKGIRKNLECFLDFEHSTAPATILDNYDWYKQFDLLTFLRDVGKHFRVGPMLAKESVKARLASEEGMSFTEFTYQLLQGYDFLHLFREHGVSVQMGGSDQWGNITAGTELIRKVTGKTAYGLTFPLLTRSDGKKFGKSESGAVYLSADRCSPYQFYQYLFRMPDSDVPKLMRILTFMSMEEIRSWEERMQQAGYEPNSAQRQLAAEVTRIVHGEEGLAAALRATEAAAPGAEAVLDATALEGIADHVPSSDLAMADVLNQPLIDVYVKSGGQSSKGEARRLIRQGGAYLNNKRIEDESCTISDSDLIEGRLLLLGMGKKKKLIVRVTDPA